MHNVSTSMLSPLSPLLALTIPNFHPSALFISVHHKAFPAQLAVYAHRLPSLFVPAVLVLSCKDYTAVGSSEAAAMWNDRLLASVR